MDALPPFWNLKNMELLGKTPESEGITQHNPVFDMVITYFSNRTEFRQKVKFNGEMPPKVSAEVEFMVCDDSHCLPATYEDVVFHLSDKAQAGNQLEEEKMPSAEKASKTDSKSKLTQPKKKEQ